MCRFEAWHEQKLLCGAKWEGQHPPAPFYFQAIDIFYPPEQAERLKSKLKQVFAGREFVPVLEVQGNEDEEIRQYAHFLFQNDYAPYTAKQWGLKPEEIEPSVLARVPLRMSYHDGYFDDTYQVMPDHSFTDFFHHLLNHPNIEVHLGIEALDHLSVADDQMLIDGTPNERLIIYTGALDELFQCEYGRLPYRSLRFEWRYSEQDSYQEAPVVAYPQEAGYTRITEYKKLPVQMGKGTSYALEYPVPYEEGSGAAPYYPVLTAESQELYRKYYQKAKQIKNLICCGRLADFKYYNMDQALERALRVADSIIENRQV